MNLKNSEEKGGSSMNVDYFKSVKLLDGGMGQWLLAKGVQPKGTLWSASAVLDGADHLVLRDAHLDFIRAGCDVIVTSTFTTRRQRLIENELGHAFDVLNTRACEMAQLAMNDFPNVKIAGSLPPQNQTYVPDDRSRDEIINDFYNQASLLAPYVDFFYFDVLSSIREFECGILAIESLKKPFLLGPHVSSGTCLPSGESVSELARFVRHPQLMGVILSCVSPENADLNVHQLASLGVPFGFKMNAFKQVYQGYAKDFSLCQSGNPADILGHREDLTPPNFSSFAKRFMDLGATIIGGCCEITPNHIQFMRQMMA